MKPTIITKGTTSVEHGVFSKDGLLYQVGSNETVFWLSTDTGILEVSSKGPLSQKKPELLM